jgi:hypothetical protein
MTPPLYDASSAQCPLSVKDELLQKINDKKLLSLQPVVRTRRSRKRVGLIKRQKSSQGLAMYGHEVFISSQRKAA